MGDPDPLSHITFATELIEWRGPAPFVFAPIPIEHSDEIRWAAKQASYGWGVVPVDAVIGATRFSTSLFPRGELFLLPVKVSVQHSESVGPGSPIQATITIRAR